NGQKIIGMEKVNCLTIVEDLREISEKYKEKDLDLALEAREVCHDYLVKEMKENYPCSRLEEKVNSVDVSIIGVEHTKEFFEKYKSFLEEKISQADAVILEDVIGGNFWDHEFYRKIGEIASSQQKKVYQTDTIRRLPGFVDLLQEVAGVSLIVLGFSVGLLGFGLGSLGGTSLGVYLFLGSHDGRALRYLIHKGSHYGLDNLLSYGYTDYRDATIADGIDKLCHENDGIKKFVCIHGNDHSEPIKKYLKNPTLRKIKRLTYLPFDLIASQPIR
ncbi:unnamed protein product, partial [marine sediment metagenome]